MGLKAKAKYLIRQFPFVVPSGIIHSAREWIDNQGRRKGLYFSQRGPWYKVIEPKGFFHNAAPKTLGTPNFKAFEVNRSYTSIEFILFYLQNSFLLGHRGMILTAGHQVFQEFTHNFDVDPLRRFLWKNPFYGFSADEKRMDGTGAVLISPESNNYYHWLSDVLPRIKAYEPVLDQIDYFCIASTVPAKFLDMLPDFGVPMDKILLVGEKEKLGFSHLFVSTLPGSEGRSPQWAVDYVREKLVKATDEESPLRNIYFKRGNVAGRKIVNEDAVIAALQNEGFEIVDPGMMSVKEQIELAQQAKIIVGAHGAALSNLLFCTPGTAVIEIFTPDYFRTDCFYTLSSFLQLDYWYLVGDRQTDGGWGNIAVNEQLLIDTIRRVDGK